MTEYRMDVTPPYDIDREDITLGIVSLKDKQKDIVTLGPRYGTNIAQHTFTPGLDNLKQEDAVLLQSNGQTIGRVPMAQYRDALKQGASRDILPDYIGALLRGDSHAGDLNAFMAEQKKRIDGAVQKFKDTRFATVFVPDEIFIGNAPGIKASDLRRG